MRPLLLRLLPTVNMDPVYLQVVHKQTNKQNEGPFSGLSKGSLVGFVYGSVPAFPVGNPRVEFGGDLWTPSRWEVGGWV